MKLIKQWLFTLGVWLIAIGGIVLCFSVYNNETAKHKSWCGGYTECMNDVIEALVKHDEVRIGNLIVNEPNAYVSDTTFFCVDPDMLATVFNADNVTLSGGTYNSLCNGYEYPEPGADPNDPNEVGIIISGGYGVLIKDCTFIEQDWSMLLQQEENELLAQLALIKEAQELLEFYETHEVKE